MNVTTTNKIIRSIIIEPTCDEARMIIGDILHYQLRGNTDYINNAFILNTDKNVELHVFEDAKTNPIIKIPMSPILIKTLKISNMENEELFNLIIHIKRLLYKFAKLEYFMDDSFDIKKLFKQNEIFFDKDFINTYLKYNYKLSIRLAHTPSPEESDIEIKGG